MFLNYSHSIFIFYYFCFENGIPENCKGLEIHIITTVNRHQRLNPWKPFVHDVTQNVKIQDQGRPYSTDRLLEP